MLGTIAQRQNKDCFIQGVYSFPSLDNPVWYVTENDLDQIFDNKVSSDTIDYRKDFYLPIGTSPAFQNYKVKICPDQFFVKHAAILGNTGSGKSCTLTSILRNLFKFEYNGNTILSNAHIVIFDTNGEYKDAFISEQQNNELERINAYYYGGDVDFANQRSWLVSQGYERIISDSDFPIEDKLSKWGVHDHIVANRLLADLRKEQNTKQPMLRVFQTSSSHEPFDVPYSRLKDKRLNAFAYTDSVIGHLLREYSKLPRWKNTLVLLVADHVGAYKEHLDNFDRSRYQIPLIMTGGAIARPMNVKLIGSQHDIAATLLGQLGIPHKDFLFSKNMLSDATPKFAFFDVPDAFGMVSEENSIIYDNKSKKVVYDKGKKGYNLKRGMAYLQKLYDDLSAK